MKVLMEGVCFLRKQMRNAVKQRRKEDMFGSKEVGKRKIKK